MEDHLLQSNLFVTHTLVIKETSGPLLVVGWNDGSNEKVCNSNKKNNQKDHLSLEWQSKKKAKLHLFNNFLHNHESYVSIEERLHLVIPVKTLLPGLNDKWTLTEWHLNEPYLI